MAIVGFIALFLVMLYVTVAGGLISLNCIGTYNIGGVSNKPLTKLFGWAVAAVVAGLWWLLLSYSPFSISISM